MFIDEVKLELFAGYGGNGIVAYRRERGVEFGGPAGGSGGSGGSIIFIGDEGLSTLLDLRYNKIMKADNGSTGKAKGMNGANALDRYVRVPLGTTIYNQETNQVIGDIVFNKQEVVVAKGGRGGRGNVAFATSRNPAPELCEKGEPGEHKFVRCELKVLADCGLVGFPSVGKSTLISCVSAARPKIADYHFTTLNPNLGMVRVNDGRSFVMADLPGLIEGASQGAGLGFQFLRHIERCRVILHVIDMASVEGRDPYNDYEIIQNELGSYKYDLLKRPQIIVANKMDLPEAKENLKEFKKKYKGDAKIIEISSFTHENIDSLLYETANLLDNTEEFKIYGDEDYDNYVSYVFKGEGKPFEIELVNGFYQITGEKVRKLFEMTDFTKEDTVKRFARQLRSLGVDEELRRLGVKDGDTVYIFDYQFTYTD